MNKKIKYETPEIEITRFESEIRIMSGLPGEDGDVLEEVLTSPADGGAGDLDDLFGQE